MGAIRLEQVTKNFDGTVVIPCVDLDIDEGEFVVFVGPSGCGKSTLLRLIAGLEDVSGGRVVIDGADATRLPPAQRGLAMVFQSYALYPHMSVYKNIAFPLKMAGSEPAAIDRKVRAAAQTLNLTEYLNYKPGQLSGGQRQRVAIGRAIVREPKAFLFDEPLSNLDAALRVNMRLEITELASIAQNDDDLRHPRPGRSHDDGGQDRRAARRQRRAGRISARPLPCPPQPLRRRLYRQPANEPDRRCRSREARCEDHRCAPRAYCVSRDAGDWVGTVGVAEHLGSDTILHVPVEGVGTVKARVEGEFGLRHGQRAYLTPDPTKIHRFDADGKTMS